MKLLQRPSFITIVLIFSITTIVASNLNWGKEHWRSIIEVDAKGYYAYLPAIFIYDDLNFGFFDAIEGKKYYNERWYYDYRLNWQGKDVNKYFCGTALAELPFFLIAHGYTLLQGLDADGYSKTYPIVINISGICYLILGLIFLNQLLKRYRISEWQRSFILLTCVFGTNLFFYTVCDPGMSHVYSFAFVSMFAYYAYRFFESGGKRHVLILAVLLGMILLIRPVNGIVLCFLPFLAGSWARFKSSIAELVSNIPAFASSIIIVAAIGSIQLALYWLATGDLFVYSYGEEGFEFASPNMVDILFSYKKGLFLYTPVYLLSLFGLYFCWKNDRYQMLSWTIAFVAITYVLSSWWNWWYGGSFSSRVFIEYLPFFMIMLAIALRSFQGLMARRAFNSLIVALILLCQVQTYQFRYYQIHWSEMTKEKYWDVFLRIDKLVP